MAFAMKIQRIAVRDNDYFTSAAVVVALLVYRHGDRTQCIHGIHTLESLAKNAFPSVVTHVSKRLLGLSASTRAVLGDYVYHTLSSIRVIFHQWWRHLFPGWSPHRTYPNKEAEQQYWDSARIFRRQLQSTDARFCTPGSSSPDQYEQRIPVISSYQPALPPWRTRHGRATGTTEYYLPTKTFRKWHRMTFPDQAPLDSLQATRMMKNMCYSTDEKREIHRISRLLPNRKAFRVDHHLVDSRRYRFRDMWDAWQEEHSFLHRDMEIVFEAE